MSEEGRGLGGLINEGDGDRGVRRGQIRRMTLSVSKGLDCCDS
jgi:hypothetical protein